MSTNPMSPGAFIRLPRSIASVLRILPGSVITLSVAGLSKPFYVEDVQSLKTNGSVKVILKHP